MIYFVVLVTGLNEFMNKKRQGKKILASILFVAIFGALGFFGTYFAAEYFGGISFLDILYTVFIVLVSFPLHIVLHELGHLLGGLLSGYDFIMFRLFRTVWIKTKDGLSKRKEYIQGVMGQALMAPPEMEEKKQPPSFLYHASGLLANLLTAVLFIFLGRGLSNGAISYFFYVSAIVALLLLLLNAIPLQGTDGYNILEQFKRLETKDNITTALYMYRDMVQGASFADVQKYVDLDANTSLKGATAATMYTVKASYFLERKDFEAAHDIYKMLWENIQDLFPGHQPAVALNYLFTLLLTNPAHRDVNKIAHGKFYKDYLKVKQADYLRIYAAKFLYADEAFEKAERLLDEGEQYIHLAPTVTEEKFEEKMYHYLREELHRLRNET